MIKSDMFSSLPFLCPSDGSAGRGGEALPAGLCQRLLRGRPGHRHRPGQGGVRGEGGGRLHAGECTASLVQRDRRQDVS